MKLQTQQIRDVSSWTVIIFGMLAFVLGVLGLLRPEIILQVMGIDGAELIGALYTGAGLWYEQGSRSSTARAD